MSRSSHTQVSRQRSMTLESLETRRLLSYSFTIENTITDTPPQNGGSFGEVFATRGDYVLVGKPNASVVVGTDEIPAVGAAVLIQASTGNVIATFSNPAPSEYDSFGAAVTFVGSDKVAIASLEQGVESVFIYSMSGAAVGAINLSADPDGGYAHALASYGDHVIVASPSTDRADFNGTIRMYDSSGSVVHRMHSGDAGLSLNFDSFGQSLAVSGSRLAASASDFSAGRSMVLEFDLDSGSHARTYNQPATSPGTGIGFGLAMAFGGNDLFISENTEMVGGRYEAVYRYNGSNEPVQTLALNAPMSGFGLGLAVSGGRLAVGANGYAGESGTMGAVFVYDIGSTQPLVTIDNPQTDPYSGWLDFGSRIGALSNGRFAIVDSSRDLTGLTDAGAIDVISIAEEGTGENQAPIANAGPDLSAVRHQAITLVGIGTDNDGSIAGYQWDLDYDGQNFSVDSTLANPSISFAEAGVYTVALRVTDNVGAVSAIDTATITVTAVGMQGDDLYVSTSDAGGSVLVNSGSGSVQVQVDGQSSSYSPSGRIIVLGGAGNDVIAVTGNVTHAVEIYGGAGNDLIKGGAGNNIIVGGDGNDLIVGGTARDLLVGGNGADRIVGNASDDILIAGSTSHDSNPSALRSIMTEWTGSASYSSRVEALRASLLVTSGAGATVFDDDAGDVLTGNAGTDWFLFNVDGPVADRATDLSSSEFADDIDFIQQP